MTTSPPISTADRDKAKELCAKATKGPWTTRDPRTIAGVDGSSSTICIHMGWLPDADFIAFSRTAIPAYEARVVELEAALKAAEATIDSIVESGGKMAVRAEQLDDRLEASDARATALLEALRPFAAASQWTGDSWDGEVLWRKFDGVITVGDLRRAAAAQQDRQTEEPSNADV